MLPPQTRKRQRPGGPWRFILEELVVQLDIESQLRRSINFQLAPDINRSASPSTNPGFHRRRVLRLCLRPTSDLRRPSILRRCQGVDFQLPPELHPTLHLQISFQLAPDTASSDFAFGPTSNSSSDIESSSCTFQPAVDFRRPPTFRFCLRTEPPAFAGTPILQLHLRTDLRLASELASSGSAFQPNLRLFIGTCVSNFTFQPTTDSHRPSTFRLCPPFDLRLSPVVASSGFPFGPSFLHPPVLSATNLRSRSEFESSSGAVDFLPTCVGS
jgi:hypothetical protein